MMATEDDLDPSEEQCPHCSFRSGIDAILRRHIERAHPAAHLASWWMLPGKPGQSLYFEALSYLEASNVVRSLPTADRYRVEQLTAVALSNLPEKRIPVRKVLVSPERNIILFIAGTM